MGEVIILIPNLVFEYLKENNISKEFLLKVTNLDEDCINNIINNKKKLSIDEYTEICSSLNLSFDYFFTNNFE